MQPSIGRIVHYSLTQQDADTVAQNRARYGVEGNPVAEGDTFPAIIVRVWSTDPGDGVNLQVWLDGPDMLWSCSRREGDGPGTWSWPPRV